MLMGEWKILRHTPVSCQGGGTFSKIYQIIDISVLTDKLKESVPAIVGRVKVRHQPADKNNKQDAPRRNSCCPNT
jgi:hypothetical protein